MPLSLFLKVIGNVFFYVQRNKLCTFEKKKENLNRWGWRHPIIQTEGRILGDPFKGFSHFTGKLELMAISLQAIQTLLTFYQLYRYWRRNLLQFIESTLPQAIPDIN